mmetsp:Transcript_64115/g.185840  ORF Transcript_64115/g.185840 Transcript_64115/m.185840 type:complete len:222 (+) Transcript_64115:581-1246(+)
MDGLLHTLGLGTLATTAGLGVTAPSEELTGTVPCPQRRRPLVLCFTQTLTISSCRRSSTRSLNCKFCSHSGHSHRRSRRDCWVFPSTARVAYTSVSGSSMPVVLPFCQRTARAKPRARNRRTWRLPTKVSASSKSSSSGQCHFDIGVSTIVSSMGPAFSWAFSASSAQDSKGTSERSGSSMLMLRFSLLRGFRSGNPHAMVEVRDAVSICVSDFLSLSWKL